MKLNRRGFMAFLGSVPLAPFVVKLCVEPKKAKNLMTPEQWATCVSMQPYENAMKETMGLEPRSIMYMESDGDICAGDPVMWDDSIQKVVKCDPSHSKMLGFATGAPRREKL